MQKLIVLFLLFSFPLAHADHCRVRLYVEGFYTYGMSFNQALKQTTVEKLRQDGISDDLVYLDDIKDYISFDPEARNGKCYLKNLRFAGERFPSGAWSVAGTSFITPFAVVADYASVVGTFGMITILWKINRQSMPVTHGALLTGRHNNRSYAKKLIKAEDCTRERIFWHLGRSDSYLYCNGARPEKL